MHFSETVQAAHQVPHAYLANELFKYILNGDDAYRLVHFSSNNSIPGICLAGGSCIGFRAAASLMTIGDWAVLWCLLFCLLLALRGEGRLVQQWLLLQHNKSLLRAPSMQMMSKL